MTYFFHVLEILPFNPQAGLRKCLTRHRLAWVLVNFHWILNSLFLSFFVVFIRDYHLLLSFLPLLLLNSAVAVNGFFLDFIDSWGEHLQTFAKADLGRPRLVTCWAAWALRKLRCWHISVWDYWINFDALESVCDLILHITRSIIVTLVEYIDCEVMICFFLSGLVETQRVNALVSHPWIVIALAGFRS